MITREDLLKSSEYWIETIQNKLFNELVEYIDKNNISNKIIAERLGLSKGRISQILSGKNLNFRIDTLVKLCLAIERVPEFRLIKIEDFIALDKLNGGSVIFENSESFYNPISEILEYKPEENFLYLKMKKKESFEMDLYSFIEYNVSKSDTKAA